MAVQTILQDVAPTGRRLRRPRHTFNLKTKPYDIQPFFLAPVLAGETMKNLLVQSRVVSDPVNNPLMGWWKEYYFFYVKLRDLASRDKYTAMLLNPQEDMTSQRTSGQSVFNHPANGVNYTLACLRRVVDEYFRDNGKTYSELELNSIPQAYAHGRDESWLDSLTLDAEMPEYNPDETSEQADEVLRTQWEFMRAQRLTNMSFEDYLGTFGVNTPQEPNKPELVRMVKEWTYPSNTINPAGGAPSSALSWSIQERADKDRFFREPGFLFGVTVARPKILLSGITGSLSHFLDNAFSWLPALMADQPETSLRNFTTGTGPVPGITDVGGYWVDLRDLFLYGEQFTNYVLSAEANINKAANPTSAGVFKFLTDAERTALFKVSTSNVLREDGVVSLHILGSQVEMT